MLAESPGKLEIELELDEKLELELELDEEIGRVSAESSERLPEKLELGLEFDEEVGTGERVGTVSVRSPPPRGNLCPSLMAFCSLPCYVL